MSGYELRIIERGADTIVRVHHAGTKDAARTHAKELAERLYPTAQGFAHRWNADCRMVMRDGAHVADIAVEPGA